MKTKNPSSIFTILKNPTSLMLMLGFLFVFFDLQYLIMSRLPGSANEMCVMGGGLNASNITFAMIISALGGLSVSGLFRTFAMRQISLGALSVSSIGVAIGTLTVFCTACTIPVISLFGLAVGISFFTTYNIWFKLVSLTLMLIALYQLDKQIRGECERCVE